MNAEPIAPYEQDLGRFLSGQGYQPVELTRNKAGHLTITATVNNVEGLFILDTGAGCTIIDATSAGKLDLRLQTDEMKQKGAGAGGNKLQVTPSKGNSMVINDLVIKDHTLSVMNLEHVKAAYKELGIDDVFLGVIGADILDPHEAVIDYSRKKLWLKYI